MHSKCSHRIAFDQTNRIATLSSCELENEIYNMRNLIHAYIKGEKEMVGKNTKIRLPTTI
jgi:hypothetical protein